MRVFKGELRDAVDLLAFGPGERLAAASFGRGRVDVWDCVTGNQADAWRARGEDRRELAVTDLGFLPDGRVLACVEGHPLQIIDPDSDGRDGSEFPSAEPTHLRSPVRVAAAGDAVFASTERVAAASAFPAVSCWRPDGAGRYAVAWSAPCGLTACEVAASPDGRSVVVAEMTNYQRERSLVLRDGATGAEVRRFTPRIAPWGVRERLRFAPDGGRIMVVWYDATDVWDAAAGERAGRLTTGDPETAITDAAYHSSGRWIFTSGLDGRVRVWDAERLVEAGAFEWNLGRLRSVAVGADGTIAAAGGVDGGIVVWDVDL